MTSTSLPRGRHKLGREAVRAAQRERILAAVTTTMAEHGYADTPVSAVLDAAGVSRETFYQLFDGKGDAFAAALGEALDRMQTALGAVPATGEPLDQLSVLLRSYLELLGSEPALARLFLVETYAAGPAARQTRLASQQAFADGVAVLFGHATGTSAYRRCEAFVGAVVAMTTTRVGSPELGPPAELHPTLLDVAARLLT